jgi:hypothetical protein
LVLSLADGGDVEVAVRRESGDELVVFPRDFPGAPPSLTFASACKAGAETSSREPSPEPAIEQAPAKRDDEPAWNASGDIYADFTEYYNQKYLYNCAKEKAC